MNPLPEQGVLIQSNNLGIINISNLLGFQVFKAQQSIDFVIELLSENNLKKVIDQQEPEQLLTTQYTKWHYQTCSISGISINLYPNRDLPLIINLAIKQFIIFTQSIGNQ